jgi:hypothetical protein
MGAGLLILGIGYLVYRTMARKGETSASSTVEPLSNDELAALSESVPPAHHYRWVPPHGSSDVSVNASDDGHWML